jgi:NDP-sugar pyrophosphorylase family protein
MEETPVFPEISSLDNEISRTQVLVFAGGQGRRMGVELPKALVRLDGQTLVERCVRFFARAGFSDFVFLLRHGHEKVYQHLNELDLHGMRTSFSVCREGMEAGRENGRAKALKYALEMGHVNPSKRCLVTFPDDIFTDETLLPRILGEHLRAVNSLQALGSLVLTNGMRWPYGTAEVDRFGLVRSFTEKPFVHKPTSVGNYLMEPEVYGLLSGCVDMNNDGPLELEQTVIPLLSRMGRLHGVFIPSQSWLPINTQKDLEEAERGVAALRLPIGTLV